MYLSASSRHVSCHPLDPQLLSRPHHRLTLHSSLFSRPSTHLLPHFGRTSQNRYGDKAVRERHVASRVSTRRRVRRLQVVGSGCGTDAAGGGLWVAGQWLVDTGGGVVRVVAGMVGRGRDCESVIITFGGLVGEKKLP